MSDIIAGSNVHAQPSFTLKNRLMRVLWNSTYFLFFRFSPRSIHPWRVFLLRCFGAKIGKGCHIYPKARIWAPWNLVMEERACIANDVECYSMAKISIGAFSVVSQGVRIITGTHDYEDPNFQLMSKPVHIGAETWIASEAFLCPGVTVNEGAIVGARAVVTKDLEGWKVYAGNPCGLIRNREMSGREVRKSRHGGNDG